MDYFYDVLKAINYIEDHLTDDITQEDVAKHCGFSIYHFHRAFQAAVKDSVTGYIRERRLTHAARDLLNSEVDLIHLALDYQFGSHEAFTRAFKKMFGVTPSMFRQNKDGYQTLLRVSQRRRMDPHIVRHLMHGLSPKPQFMYKVGFSVIGISMHSREGGNFSEAWDEFNQRRYEIPNIQSECAFGLISKTGVNVEFNYIACVEVSSGSKPPKGMIHLDVPGNDYAVFRHFGSHEYLSDSWAFALGIWLPKSKYRRADSPEFELYYPENTHEQRTDIYIPIRQK